MTIIGWDRTAKFGRRPTAGPAAPYIREVGGMMTLTDVRASSLGFWSGRTGGVAWTGVTGTPSTGGATSSTFTGDTYGAFVARGRGVTFTRRPVRVQRARRAAHPPLLGRVPR